MKRSLSLVTGALVAASLVLSACAPAASTAAPEVEPTAETPKTTCALITPNPRGDRSFIDSAVRGIERANAELPVDCDIIETNGVAEHESAMRGAIQKGYDLIMGLALDAKLMTDLAAEFPDQKFGSPSEVFAETLPANLVSYQIDVHQSSFLVGLIVGKLTTTKTVGAVVGGDAPSLNQFYYGYKQGVLEVCPDCTVLVSYLGFDFSNPTLGLETAKGLYDKGADIVYQVAGRSGEGVLEAAAQADRFAIGVDSNQDFIQPGHVITSMIKRVDMTTYLTIQSVVEGKFEGGFKRLGMADGAAGLSWDEGSTTFADEGPDAMTAMLPEIQTLVEDYRTKILAGEFEVCDALSETDVCAALK